jgi:hypothetical protein
VRLSLKQMVLLTIICLPVFGQTVLETNWAGNEIVMTLTREVEEFTPAERSRVYREAGSGIAGSFISAAAGLQIDSATRLSDWINTNPRKLSDLTSRIEATPLEAGTYSREFGSLSLRYRIPLFPDIAGTFIEHRRGYTLPASLFYVPSAPFSGILIYASGELPVHGENRSAELRPALFPRIWDTEMKLLFESRMMDREDLLRTGPVAYTDSLNAEAIAKRVGPNPIRILARGVFGLTPTDPIIPREDALAIRNSSEGAELLRRGKIMIVIAPE